MIFDPSLYPRVPRNIADQLDTTHGTDEGEHASALMREEISRRILEDWPAIHLSFIRDVVIMAGQYVLDQKNWFEIEGRSRRLIYATERLKHGKARH